MPLNMGVRSNISNVLFFNIYKSFDLQSDDDLEGMQRKAQGNCKVAEGKY